MSIKGITVKLETASPWWSDSADALFLGVYGLGGGREFRLNKGMEIGPDGHDFSLVLGDPCCKSGTDQQVPDSINNLGDNSPKINPISLKDVKYVYIRKATATGQATSDDWLRLDFVSVLLCDDYGNMRRFSKSGELNLSDETGLQHWLREVSPPRCQVVVNSQWVEQHAIQNKAAGRDWTLELWASLNGGSWQNVFTQNHYVSIPMRDNWTVSTYGAAVFSHVGCCGQQMNLRIFASAEEHDHFGSIGEPNPDDSGHGFETFKFECTTAGIKDDHSIKFIVDEPKRKNRKSELTFHYNVSAVCIP